MQKHEEKFLQPAMPSSWLEDTKPHKFCPGCGHGIILKVSLYIKRMGTYSIYVPILKKLYSSNK